MSEMDYAAILSFAVGAFSGCALTAVLIAAFAAADRRKRRPETYEHVDGDLK